MENNQFAQPDKAVFLLTIIFFPLILVGYLCYQGWWWVGLRMALRKARKSTGRKLTDVEELNVRLGYIMRSK